MERPSPVPEHQGRSGHAGTVDIVSIQRAVQAGQERTTDNPWGPPPLHVPSFRETVLAQLGERRHSIAIDADLAGQSARARPLDADTKGPLRDIHRRVGTAMLFESSGGMVEKVAHLPRTEIRPGRTRRGKPRPSTAQLRRWNRLGSSFGGSGPTGTGFTTKQP